MLVLHVKDTQVEHVAYTVPAAACLTDWQQGHYAKTCLGKLSSKT